jgi:ParB-like chromosome segregation protein Spo0J
MFSQKKMMPLDKIVLDPKNVRRHDEKNIKAIMHSLESSYQRKPIVLYGTTVIAGNGTVEAARRLGWKEIWVNDDPFESEEAAKAYALADNRTNDLSDFDNELLKDELKALDALGWDLERLGWDDADLKLLNPDLKDINGAKELDENEFSTFDHQCPKCGFEFDGEK